MTRPVKDLLKNNRANSSTIVTITSLYELIGALNKKIEPNRDNLITAVVADLIGARKIKWIRSGE